MDQLDRFVKGRQIRFWVIPVEWGIQEGRFANHPYTRPSPEGRLFGEFISLRMEK